MINILANIIHSSIGYGLYNKLIKPLCNFLTKEGECIITKDGFEFNVKE